MSSKIAFQKGWRASKDKFRIYNISEGPLMSTGIDPETWDLLRFQEREHISATWKERHAKGVPVKMELDEWRDCIRNTQKIDNVHPSRHEHHGGITIWVEDWNDDVSDETVKFCNFRYKPEWLEKKGQTNN